MNKDKANQQTKWLTIEFDLMKAKEMEIGEDIIWKHLADSDNLTVSYHPILSEKQKAYYVKKII